MTRTYKAIQNVIFTLFFCFLAAGPVFAQSNAQMMQEIMVHAMLQYGQKLYDRGDFDEATAVFNHVLSYDNHQAKALGLLKQMGRLPIPTSPQEINLMDDGSLKAAIEAKKQSIEKLKAQIKLLRDRVAANQG